MSKIGRDIIAGLEQALAYARGEHVPGIRVHYIEVPDKGTRTQLRQPKGKATVLKSARAK